MRYALAALFLVACGDSCGDKPAAPADVQTVQDAGSDAVADDDDVKPVYPDAPTNALAARFCDALHKTQATRRQECCSAQAAAASSAGDIAQLCTKNLSAAMMLKSVDIAQADIDACAAAIDKTFAGCDWVGPLPPAIPNECQSVIKGKLAAGVKCRSTLECADGQACHGVGPTNVGKCGPAFADGQPCGGSADVLVSYARQDAAERAHPECTGLCLRGRCATPAKIGDACFSSEQCGGGAHCRNDKCALSPGKAGEQCAATSPCDKGLVCQTSGRCGPERKAAGSACKTDLECLGGCVKGKCAMKCDAL